jgi:hypothetical protein
MRRLTLCCCAAVLTACAPKDSEPPKDETADAGAAAPAAPAAIALSDVAGTWKIAVMPESGDTTYFTFDMVATDTRDGWSFNFANRDPIPLRVVAVDGDSIVSEAGPFASNLRKGATVTLSRTVNRIQDGKLVGTTTAHYDTKSADSVITLRFEGTRAP